MWPALGIAALFLFQAPDDYAEGMKALEEARYEAAEAAFANAVAAAPDDYAANFHLALARSFTGKTAEAIAGYEKVLELKPGLYEAELNLGVLLLNENRLEQAVKLLDAALQQKPGEFRPNYYLAEGQLQSGDFAGAEQHFRKAAEIDPSHAAVEFGLARSLARQQRLDDAAPHYRKASEMDPALRDGLLELAEAYEKNKRYDDAAALYRQFPDDPAVQERLGQLLLEEGHTEDALPSLERAVRESPTAANRYALAVAYLRQKQLDRAAEQLQLAVAAAPDNFALRMSYGRALRDQRKFAGAAAEFTQAMKLQPDTREVWEELVGALFLSEDYDQALVAIDRVEQLGGERPGLHYLRALIYDKRRQYEPALASYQKFLELSHGASPDEEFKARQRSIAIRQELSR